MARRKLVRALSSMIIASLAFATLNSVYAQESNDGFSDLSADHINYEAITYLNEIGIISGYPDGTVKPDQNITRAELLKIIVEAIALTPETLEYNRCFPDVDILEWYIRYVCYGKDTGIVEGYEDGTFRPGENINNIEILSMIFKSQDLPMPRSWEIDYPFDDVDVFSWYGPYVWFAKDNEIVDSDSNLYNPGEIVTRGQAFEILYRTLLVADYYNETSLYTFENISFTHTNFYSLDSDAWLEGGVVFSNQHDDGLALISEYNFNAMLEADGLTIEDIIYGSEGNNIDINVRSGEVSNLLQFNEIMFEEDDAIILFKVEPVFSNNPAFIVIGHYTSDRAYEEVLNMIRSIVIK